MRDEILIGMMSVYEQAILSWGIIPILRILRRNEIVENFEECEIIVRAIDDLNRFTGGTMPTKIEEAEIDKIKSAFDRFGGELTGEKYVSRLNDYTRQARKEIEESRLALYQTLKNNSVKK